MAATKLLSDNGVTSGITGYQLTGGNDGTLQLQTTTSGGTATTAMTIDTAQQVGIGTTSPGYKLDVRNTGNSSIACVTSGSTSIAQVHAIGTAGATSYFWQASSSYATYHSLVAGNAGIYASTNLSYEVDGALYQSWWTNGNERMRIDSSGNLGVGITPSGWGGGLTTLQMAGPSLWGASGLTHLTTNTYYDGANYKYIASTYATDYYQYGGVHVWRTAPSGTAGANITTFTESMRIDSSGNVGINVAPSSWGSNYRALQLNSGSFFSNTNGNGIYVVQNTYYNGTSWIASTTGSASIYTQAAGAHQFFTGSASAGAAITPEALLTLGTDGSMTFGKTTGGIVFNKSGALTNSLLNDYEVGSWTPTSLTTNVSITAIQSTSYVKVGRQVTAYCYIQVTNSTGATANWACGGLPFTASNTYGPAFKYYNSNVYNGATYVESGSTYIFDNNGLTTGAQGIMLCATYTSAT